MGNTSVKGHEVDDHGPTLVARHLTSSTSDSDTEGKGSEPYSAAASFISSQSDGLLPTVFRWDGQGKDVCISGSFDDWSTKIPLVKSRHDLFTIIDLPVGSHQYKFFVDGQWHCDEKEPMTPNSFGTHNNVVTVQASDFEAFQALGVDSLETGHHDDNYYLKYGRPRSPPGDYCRIIPPKETRRRVGPPVLPPQLLQIVLNQEVPRHCEPFLLPKPNHVMLNHLYALSIKDGVMILSSTFRYRKKYITTVLYKPI